MEWISVKDKLPHWADDGTVIIYLPEKMKAFEHPWDELIPGVMVVELYEVDESKAKRDGYEGYPKGSLIFSPLDKEEWALYYPFDKVTHWMPMPDPPKP